MSFNLDDANIGGQLKVGTGIFPAIGEGPLKVNGSAGMEGPIVIGKSYDVSLSLCYSLYCTT